MFFGASKKLLRGGGGKKMFLGAGEGGDVSQWLSQEAEVA